MLLIALPKYWGADVDEWEEVAEGDWLRMSKPSCGSIGGDGGTALGLLTVGGP